MMQMKMVSAKKPKQIFKQQQQQQQQKQQLLKATSSLFAAISSFKDS